MSTCRSWRQSAAKASTVSSARSVGMLRPCLTALSADFRFPLVEIGPVLDLALRRFAAVRFSLMGNRSGLGGRDCFARGSTSLDLFPCAISSDFEYSHPFVEAFECRCMHQQGLSIKDILGLTSGGEISQGLSIYVPVGKELSLKR